MSRYDILHRIEQLDPIKDHVEIYRLLVCYEFPWDYIRSLEVALYRTYCVPSISALLDQTGELVYRTQKRYDDTAILIAEWPAFGYDSERGRAALRRMNIKNIPETCEEFEQYNLAYERKHFVYADTNRRVGEATRDLFLSWFPLPGFLRSMLRPAPC